MRRSLKKAVAFLTFLAMAFQIFVTTNAEPVKAAQQAKIGVNEWGEVFIEEPAESVTIPADFDTDYISISLYELGVKSLTVESGYSSVSIYSGGDLEELYLPKGLTELYLSDCPKLKSIIIPAGTSTVSLYNLPIESVDIPASVSDLTLSFCESLKNVDIKKGLQYYSQWNCPKAKINLPSTVSNIYADDFTNVTISSDNPYYSVYEGSLYYGKTLQKAANKSVLNIKPGTESIGTWALSSAYAVTTINFPDSVKMLEYGALAGAKKVKQLSLPKGLVCIYSYAFDGVGADSIRIPASVEYVEQDLFGGYEGVVNLENNYNSVLSLYNGGVYTSDMGTLLYYPKNKSTLSLYKDCVTIGYTALNGCPISELDLPEGMSYMNLDLSNCKKLKTINIPASVWYISTYEMQYRMPKSLKKFTVAADNECYSSYQGCLYSKDKGYLYFTPFQKTDVKVCRGCVTIEYGGLGADGFYDAKTDEYVSRKVDVEIPSTVASIYDFYAVGNAKVESGTNAARLICEYNEWAWTPVSYEFTDTSKVIIKKIATGDDIQLKKGKKTQFSYTYPWGLVFVDKFSPIHDGNNIYAKVTYSSTNKSVAKVSKTGEITGVKKGKATIKAKFELADGTKRTIKVKVNVK